MEPVLKTPVMHKSAVPHDSPHKHTFMFQNSPGRATGVHKTVQSAEDLVSVTVRKDTPAQKAGISLVERQNGTYVTKVDENGLFYDTEVAEGDKVLSLNGKRLKKGEGAKHILKTITKAKATVTMVVKKAGITPSRGSRGAKVKKKSIKIFQKDLHRKEDLSLDPDHDPRILRQDTDDKDQQSIKANKIHRDQPLGVSLVEHKNMIFVSGIASESPFHGSLLQVGDRVVGVGSMNFMTYADAALATKMAQKAPKEVEFVVEKGHDDIPDSVRNKMEEIAILQSPLQEDDDGRIELDVDDLITPREQLNSSSNYPLRTQLHLDVPRKPHRSLNNSFNVSSLSAYGTRRQHASDVESSGKSDNEENNRSVDLADRVLARQASNGTVKSLVKSGHSSLSQPDQKRSPGMSKNRKGKRPSQMKSKSSHSRSSTKMQQTKATGSTHVIDDTSDESSLDHEVEKSLSIIKKKSSLHNSWSHPDHAKSQGASSVISKKVKRQSSSNHSRTGMITEIKPIRYKPGNRSNQAIVNQDDDDDDSTLDEDLEVTTVEMISSGRNARHDTNLCFNKSKMTREDYNGDIIRIKVKKKSESEPGINVRKSAGIFILTSVPEHEKRINVGAQVLAINGDMNINTVIKAQSLMRQTKEFVTLMVDFSTQSDKRCKCPCCGDPIFPNGEHVHPKDSTTNDDSGLFTPKASNNSGHGPRTNLLTSKYNVDEYKSESEEDDDEDNEGKPLFDRPSTSRYRPGDKFIIRLKTNGNPGISLFDYKGSIYVGTIKEGGAFYSTSIDVGDKLLSMNGKKAEVIKSASDAMSLMEEKETVILYVCRSDKTSAEYMEAVNKR